LKNSSDAGSLVRTIYSGKESISRKIYKKSIMEIWPPVQPVLTENRVAGMTIAFDHPGCVWATARTRADPAVNRKFRAKLKCLRGWANPLGLGL
jgi:hypothetical protein